MSNNLHSHSKDPGFQAIYKLSQLEKAYDDLLEKNKQLVKSINEEYLPMIDNLVKDKQALVHVAIRAVAKLGGSLEITEEEYNNTDEIISSAIKEDNKTAIFTVSENPNKKESAN